MTRQRCNHFPSFSSSSWRCRSDCDNFIIYLACPSLSSTPCRLSTWRSKFDFVVNWALHAAQQYGLSPVWVIKWRRSDDAQGKVLSHWNYIYKRKNQDLAHIIRGVPTCVWFKTISMNKHHDVVYRGSNSISTVSIYSWAYASDFWKCTGGALRWLKKSSKDECSTWSHLHETLRWLKISITVQNSEMTHFFRPQNLRWLKIKKRNWIWGIEYFEFWAIPKF